MITNDSRDLQNTINTDQITVASNPAATGRILLEAAGLNTLMATSQAVVSDPGQSVLVTGSGGEFNVEGAHSTGYLVVDESNEHYRGWVYQTFAGAAAQAWMLVSIQDTGTVAMTAPDSDTQGGQVFNFHGEGPLGHRSVTVVNLSQAV
jgi:hypothetical protein